MFFVHLVIGGLIVAIVPELAKRTDSKAAGILLCVPLISLLALYFANQSAGIETAAKISSAALVGLLPLALFFISASLAFRRMPFEASILIAFAVWLAAACLLLFATR